MASLPYMDYEIIWLQPDGTWCESPFKAHWHSEPWRHYKVGYMIPCVMCDSFYV